MPATFWEWLAEILRHSAILGWAAKHVESDFQNLAGMFLHNSVFQNQIKRILDLLSHPCRAGGICQDSKLTATPRRLSFYQISE